MKWASAISHQLSVPDTVAECARTVRAELVSEASAALEPDLVVVFTSVHYVGQASQVLGSLHEEFPKALVFGCTGAGVIGAGHEVEGDAAFSLTVAHLPGVTLSPFHVDAATLPSPDAAPGAWEDLTGVEAGLDPQFVVLADPFSMNADELIQGLDFAFPAATKIGGLASGAERPGGHVLYLGDGSYDDGAVGVALSGNVVVDTVVAQGCRPIGRTLRVTEADRNLLITLDGEPALTVLQEMFETLDAHDQRLAQGNLFLGLAPPPGLGLDALVDPAAEDEPAGREEYLVRNVMGADPERGVVAIGALLEEGQEVRFHVRDAGTSAEDLRSALGAYAQTARGMPAEGALLFSCTGRGRGLYGEIDHDTGLFRDLVGTLPLGGFFCNGEIGRVGGATHLHSYTSSFGLFRSRTAPD